MAALSIVVWELVAADLTFVSDDWKVLADRDLSLQSLLIPYNEHLSAIPIAVLVILRDSIGLGWHGVFLLPALLANVAAAAGVLLAALRRRSAASALLLSAGALFLGTGWNDLLWTWQLGAVISVAAGIWALVCLDARRPKGAAAAGLIAIALASSSFGIAFAGAGLALAAMRRAPRAVMLLGLVCLTYEVWYVCFHFSGPTLCPTPSLTQLIASAGPFALSALIYGTGAPLGLGHATQGLMPLAAVVLTLWLMGTWAAWRKGGAELCLAAAAVSGVVVMGALIAFGRSCLTIQAPGASRYVYAIGMLVLLAFAGTHLAGPVDRLRLRVPRPFVAGGLALVILLQAVEVSGGHAALLASSDTVRAGVTVVLSDSTGRCNTRPAVTDDVTSDIYMLPSPARLRALVSSPDELAVPTWLRSTGPDSALSRRVRDVMCASPGGLQTRPDHGMADRVVAASRPRAQASVTSRP